MPSATVQWEDDSRVYSIKNSHLEPYPIFAFKRQYFYKDLLPQGIIYDRKTFATPVVSGKQLDSLINELLDELKHHQKKLSHFTILQKKNFNFSRLCGLLVLKFNDYPFVLKLFIEHPDTFFDYYAKGSDPVFFFYMAGGANRHVGGLTRIENRRKTLEKIAAMPEWKGRIEAPRKWFWEPKDNKWMVIHGRNMSKDMHTLTTHIPGTYAIVADEIDTAHEFSMPRAEKTKTIMKLSNDLDLFIDAHENNFIFTQELVDNKPKIIIIDTEHFPSIVGIKHKHNFNSYAEWYAFLAQKCFHDCYLRTKDKRQNSPLEHHELMLWPIST
jgi:hypothetical protein